tara:strand:+ start:5847 stop:9305 length:3459 start_codon:yes stop_codon:yes gene_type:complete
MSSRVTRNPRLLTGGSLKITSAAVLGDYLNIAVGSNGATTLSTVEDGGGTQATLTLNPGGYVGLNPGESGFSDGIKFLFDGTEIGNLTGHHAATYLRFYENAGASTDDFLDIQIAAAGATTITTNDNAGTDGDITLKPDGDLFLDTLSVTSATKFACTGTHFGSIGKAIDSSIFILYENGGASTDDLFKINCFANGATTLTTVDDAGAAGHLTLDIDGDIILDPNSGITKFYLAGDTDDLCTLTVAANGVTTLAAAGTNLLAPAHLTLDAMGLLKLDGAWGIEFIEAGTTFGKIEVDTSSQFTLYEQGGASASDYFTIACATNGATLITTTDDAGADGHLELRPDGDLTLDCGRLNLDGSTVTNFIKGGTTFGIFDAGDSTTTFTLYEAGGSSTDDFFTIDVGAAGATTIGTVDAAANAANLTFQIDGDTIIDRNVTNTSLGTYTGLDIDMDKTGASTSDNTVYGIRCMVDAMQSTNGTNTMYGIYTANRFRHAADAGTITGYGAYMWAAGGSNGTSKMIGALVGASDGDTNIGVQIECTDGGEDLKIVSSANASDYFTIATTANGATTLTTVDDVGIAAHLTLDPAGTLVLDTGLTDDDFSGILLKQEGTTFGSLSAHHSASHFLLAENAGASLDDYLSIKCEANGVSTIETVDAAGADAHLTLDPDGELNLTPATEVKSDAPLKIKEAGSAVANTAAYGQLWVKTATPNELYFTTDAGNDIQLTSGTSIAGGSGGSSGTTTRYDGFAVGGLTSYLSSTTSYYFNYYAGYYYWSGNDSSPQTLSYSYAAAFQWVAPETCTLEEIIVTSRVTSTDDFSVYVYAYPLANNTTLWELSDMNGHLVGSITGISPTSTTKVRRIKKTFTANNQIVKGTGLLCMLKKDAHSVSQRHYINVSPRVKYQWQNQKSALFNGTDQAFYLDQHANLLAAGYPHSDMTFSAWINADDISTDGATRAIWYWGGYGESSGNNHRMSCSIKNRRLRCFNEHGSGSNEDHSSDTDLNADTWYHVACVLSGTTLKFYVNGSADGDATLGTAPDGGTSAGSSQMKAVIGAAGVNTVGGELTGYFDGHIHNLAIYVGRALSASAIAAIYNSGTPTDLKEIATNYVQADIDALMLWFTFDEVSGGEVVDRANGLVTATNENSVTTESVVPS